MSDYLRPSARLVQWVALLLIVVWVLSHYHEPIRAVPHKEWVVAAILACVGAVCVCGKMMPAKLSTDALHARTGVRLPDFGCL